MEADNIQTCSDVTLSLDYLAVEIGSDMVFEFGADFNSGFGSVTYRIGLGDADTGEFTDGVYFESTNTFWKIGTANNGTRTETTTAIAVVDGGYANLKWVVNGDSTSVEYFINGVSAGTIATNIPTTRDSGPVIMVDQTAAGNRMLDVDYYNLYRPLPADRS
jgi:hypothetical protein